MAQNVIRWEDAHEYTAEMSEGPQRNYVRTYYATLRHVSVDPFYIFQYRLCPQLGKNHQCDPYAYCIRVRLSQVEATRIWKVAAEWSTNITDPNNAPNPLNRPAKISTTSTIKDVPTLLDARGLPRVNTAGDLVPGTTSKPFQNIRVEKNVSKIPDWWWNLPGAVNKSAVTIRKRKHPPRTLKLLNTEEPDLVLENGVWFLPLVFNLERDYETWDTVEVSRGFHELVPGFITTATGLKPTFNKKRITIGTPPEYPKEKQYLDKFGRAILPSPDKKNPGIDLTKIHIERKRDLREADFKALPFK